MIKTHLAGAVEYSDCIFAEGSDSFKGVLDMTLKSDGEALVML